MRGFAVYHTISDEILDSGAKLTLGEVYLVQDVVQDIMDTMFSIKDDEGVMYWFSLLGDGVIYSFDFLGKDLTRLFNA